MYAKLAAQKRIAYYFNLEYPSLNLNNRFSRKKLRHSILNNGSRTMSDVAKDQNLASQVYTAINRYNLSFNNFV